MSHSVNNRANDRVTSSDLMVAAALGAVSWASTVVLLKGSSTPVSTTVPLCVAVSACALGLLARRICLQETTEALGKKHVILMSASALLGAFTGQATVYLVVRVVSEVLYETTVMKIRDRLYNRLAELSAELV